MNKSIHLKISPTKGTARVVPNTLLKSSFAKFNENFILIYSLALDSPGMPDLVRFQKIRRADPGKDLER